MIDPSYCRVMARYNAWQNKQLSDLLEDVPEAELTRDRGAFFGSIFATLNHLLWADRLWMSRLADWEKPTVGGADSTRICPTFAVWTAERYRADGHIELWAEKVKAVDLAGNLTWYSGLTGKTQSKPMGLCVAHLFNHQTHHRGQVHAMITAMGHPAPVSDLVFMPDEV